MSETRYRYNYRSLSYEKVEVTLRHRIYNVVKFFATGLVFATVIVFFAYTFIDSPKEKLLKRENEQFKLQYQLIDKRLEQIAMVLSDLETRDDNIYRVIFEAEPIPKNIRKAGYGGMNRYKELQGFDNSKLVIQTHKQLDKIAKQLYIQSRSFDDVIEMAKQKEEMLACIPAILPISNKDLTHMASGFGYRIDPIYKTTKFHAGMDFTAPTGTEIFATGDGKVEGSDRRMRGYGRYVVVDHGYGYKTLYAHMSKVLVRPGTKVKRGDLLGLVGCTGKCVGPHLHYEVRKEGNPINPVNFYFNDLTPEEYELMIELSSKITQSFD